MKAARIIILLLVWHASFSQFTDGFNDGDFIVNPQWLGDTADFIVEANVLRLSAPAVSQSSYLSTTSQSITNGSWKISIHLDFNPSASNYAKIYLVANNADLTNVTEGYYVKIGGTPDEVSLYRQDHAVETVVINGTDGRLNLSVVDVQILVTRSAIGEWSLLSKVANETDWYDEGSAIDFAYQRSAFFGVVCVYTSTRSNLFFFDDFIVSGSPYLDNVAPKLDTVYFIGSSQIQLTFNEKLDSIKVLNKLHYQLNGASPDSVSYDSDTVNLSFTEPLLLNYLSISGIKDLAGNLLNDTIVQVIYVDPSPVPYNAIVINEIMADPTPREDLPETEYLELYNKSSRAIDMTGWSLSDKISRGTLGKFILLPDSFLILTAQPDVAALSGYGKLMGLSPWPSLNNTGDSLTLLDANDRIMDRVVYEQRWYVDDSKEDGGWSLERINPHQTCAGYLNWHASVAISGGTPGRVNSTYEAEDSIAPILKEYSISPNQLALIFDEPLSTNTTTVNVSPLNEVVSLNTDYNILLINLTNALMSEDTNRVVISSLADCFNNMAEPIEFSFIPDFSPAQVDTVYALYPGFIEVYFNEVVLPPAPGQLYLAGLDSINESIIDEKDGRHITLHYATGLNSNESLILTINGIEDLQHNVTDESYYNFIYRPLAYPGFGDLLLTEIMADPDPPINLPPYEYIEVTNKTSERLLLKDLWLADESNSTRLTSGYIDAYERVILTKSTAVNVYADYGKTIGIINWLSLNNSGEEITLLDSEGNLINSVRYDISMYDADKNEGGWSLELGDELNYCSEHNWRASANSLGGTPGMANALQLNLPDNLPPGILDVNTLTTDSVIVLFDERLGNDLPQMKIANVEIFDIGFSGYVHNAVLLLTEPLLPKFRYQITASRIIDCVGNIADAETIELILPEPAGIGDVVINEVLFNPKNEGVDFLEIYNNSPKQISLDNWQISNGTSTMMITNPQLLAPYTYRVLTSDVQRLATDYPKAVIENLSFAGLPALPNDHGEIVLSNNLGETIDHIKYKEDWHFPYLASVEGVSLERLSVEHSGLDASNWASASELDGFATPGYRNSQTGSGNSSQALSIEPQVIVPNANGRDDFTIITLNNSTPGALVSVRIFNLSGQEIVSLANNTLLGSDTYFRWDGTDAQGAVVPLGHYFVVAETITANGGTQTLREKVVVAKGF